MLNLVPLACFQEGSGTPRFHPLESCPAMAAVFSPLRWTGRFTLARSGVVRGWAQRRADVSRLIPVDPDRASFRPDVARLRERPRSARVLGTAMIPSPRQSPRRQ